VAWALRCHQCDIDTLRRLDVAIANVETVAEEQRIAGHQVWLDRCGVNLSLGRVRCQHHDQVGLFTGLVRRQHAKTLSFGLWPALAALRQADAYVDT
jgi:hypothetical protein